MGDARQVLDFIDAAIGGAAREGLAMRTAEDERLDGREVTLDGRSVVSFTSCSYLGLEFDPRVRQGAIDAVERYGTQFSSSRSYLSAPAYEELEVLLSELFGGPALVTPNTTLAHLSALPVLIAEEDAVILDHHVHQTVHLAVPQLREQGTHVEFLRHGRLDLLEERLRALQHGHERVWYVADGIYSMFGSGAPVEALRYLAGEHEALHLYIDDAHGTSWTGRHGRGFALEHLAGFPRSVVSVSLNKSFGAGGGALVFPDEEQRRRVRTCGGPMIFTGPVQPPMLGAAIASARIHLSPEIESLQADLMRRIRHFNARARELDLPLATRSEVPIRYLGLAHPRTAAEMVRVLLERGCFVNGAIFPAVPVKKSGVRATLTRHQRLEDIDLLLETMAEHLPEVLAATEMTRETIDRSFHLRPSEPVARAETAEGLRLEHVTEIDAIDAESWDACLGGRGCFDHAALRALERAFSAGEKPEERWRFHYYRVCDAAGKPVLATFFTEALWKDDVLSEARVSERIELERRRDPYFLTSRVLGMGSLLTEGDHLYLDRAADWRSALGLLLDAVDREADACDAARVVLRDLPADDAELDAALRDRGFESAACPDTLELRVDWPNWEAHLAGLRGKTRAFHRTQVAPHDKSFEVERYAAGDRTPDAETWKRLYALYRNVHARSLDLNVYPLPQRFFEAALEVPGWELLVLRYAEAVGGHPDGPVRAFVLAWAGNEVYVPLVAGLDYEAAREHGAYRQLLRRVCLRADELGAARIAFGMGAELEKRRFGARHLERRLYFQARDHFQTDALSLISRQVAATEEDRGER